MKPMLTVEIVEKLETETRCILHVRDVTTDRKEKPFPLIIDKDDFDEFKVGDRLAVGLQRVSVAE